MEGMPRVLVIGSGIAGLRLALSASTFAEVTVVTKRALEESNTLYAQGGIASVFSEEDTFHNHIADTLEAGAGLCDEEAVRITVTEGPDRVRELIDLGVAFARREAPHDEYDLGREGGHSKRRILHAGDATGGAIERALVDAVQRNERIRVLEWHSAVDLITARRLRGGGPGEDRCLGAYVLNTRSGSIDALLADATVLATGGAGKVYLYTSNPDVATGDGIAMAYRAGVSIRDMEFIQFHPTCLYHPQARTFLVSEALRGEGGELINAAGEAFMRPLHARGSLAPRDIVARGIDREMKRTGADCVYLDMTHLDGTFLERRFPTIFATCAGYGIDLRRHPIPVVPACHYVCGGIQTGYSGETSLPGLYAVGETACTGLHGGNRLASNSLLEGVVFSHRAALHMERHCPRASAPLQVPVWQRGTARVPDEAVIVTQNWDEIRRLMWNYVGIVRSTKRLLRARRRLENLMHEIHEYYWEYEITNDFLELRNLALVARLIVESALRRTESRGLHYTLDFPEPAPCPQPSVLLNRRALEGDHWLR